MLILTPTGGQESQEEKIYDVLIIGGGPAAFTAGIYVARAMKEAIIIEKEAPGGQVAVSDIIDNFPGFIEIKGSDLANRMMQHVQKFGVPIEFAEVARLEKQDKLFVAHTADGRSFKGKTAIIATGATPKKLGVPGEDKFYGAGVSYCAVCDGHFFKDKVVAVVGGGDSAFTEALYLTGIVKKLYLIHRREGFRAQPIYVEALKKKPNVEFILNTIVREIRGDTKVKELLLYDRKQDIEFTLPVDGVFIYIGMLPAVEPFKDLEGLEYDSQGFIIAPETTETKIPGLFVAGDVRSKELRQIATAVSDGAYAGTKAVEYLEELENAESGGSN